MGKTNPYIEEVRLRSSRTRKRVAKTDYEKYLRQCCDRHAELEKQKRTMPLVPLEKPYQKGYVRFFVVRDDVKCSKLGDFFENLLAKINTYQYADNRKFQKKKNAEVSASIFLENRNYYHLDYGSGWMR